jgi:hypothetical protein
VTGAPLIGYFINGIGPKRSRSLMTFVSAFRSLSAARSLRARQFMTDTVEKGKNEPIEIFARAPVETGFSQSNASQGAYGGCWLKIRLIICPPTSFSDHRTGGSEKFRSTPRKTFFNSIDP